MEACGSLRLFFGLQIFLRIFFLSQALLGPLMATAYSAVHWGHALVLCVLLWWEWCREKRKPERKAEERGWE